MVFKLRKREMLASLPASRRKEASSEYPASIAMLDCGVLDKDLFTILFMSLGYSLESRPYSRALGTEGSVVTRGLSINRCSRGLRQLQRLDAVQAEP